MASKVNLSKENLGGFIISLLSSFYYLDEIVGQDWIPNSTYSAIVSALGVITGVTISVVANANRNPP